MAILIAETKLETNDVAWYRFYVDSKSDLESLPTSTSSGSSYSVKKHARPLSVAYCIAEARQYMLDSHDKWRPMYGLSDDVLDALDVKTSDFFKICSETKNYRDEAVSNANSSAESAAAALSSQQASSESEHNAAASEANSLEYKNSAKSSYDAALKSQKVAKQSETAASASASAALVSQNAAKDSETKAKNSENAAKASETAASDSASAAAASETNAAASESNASNSAAAALASQNAAKNSETKSAASEAAAKRSEQSAADSAAAASSSKTSAAASEATVKASATAAAESQAKAAESEKNAKASETLAGTSATNASTSAKNAASSATTATAAATTASEKATAASSSATNAAASAKAAEKSEANAKIYAEKAQLIGDSYKGWYQTEKELAADLTETKNGDWAIVGESDTIWVWDGDTSKWKCSAPSGWLNTVTITVPAKEPTENSLMWIRIGRLENTSDMDTVLLEIGGSVKIASEFPSDGGYSKENNVLPLGLYSMSITDMPQNDAADLSSVYEICEKSESTGDQRDVPFVGVEDITQTTALAEETPESDGTTASGGDSTGSISFGDISNPEFFVLATKGGDGTSCADVWLRMPYTMYSNYTDNDVSYHSKVSFSFNLDCRWYGRAGLFIYDGTQTLNKPVNGTNQKKRLTLNLVSTDNLGAGLAGDYNTAIHVTPATKDTIGGIKLSDDFMIDSDGTLRLAGGNCPFEVGDFIHTTNSVSPAARWGGTWEEVAQDRVLMGASSTHAAGTTVEAGLPNITGSTGEFASGYSSSPDRKNGALSYSGNGSQMNYYTSSGSGGYGYYIDFNASRSNAIYGRSSTVQPAAYYVHIWHRVA